jgi:hypothetical protein
MAASTLDPARNATRSVVRPAGEQRDATDAASGPQQCQAAGLDQAEVAGRKRRLEAALREVGFPRSDAKLATGIAGRILLGDGELTVGDARVGDAPT